MVNGLKNICEGDEKIHIKALRSKKKTAETAATVRRRVAFRKTQTPSANSLTERLPERKKIFFSEFLWRNLYERIQIQKL